MPISARKADTLNYFRSKTMGWHRSRTLDKGAWSGHLHFNQTASLDRQNNHSPRRIVYVSQLGWGKCWYQDCKCVQQFQAQGPHQCLGCERWLEIVHDPGQSRQEFPIREARERYDRVRCDCGHSMQVYGSGLQRCYSCQSFVDVRLTDSQNSVTSASATKDEMPTVKVDGTGVGICSNPNCWTHEDEYRQYFGYEGIGECLYCDKKMKLVQA